MILATACNISSDLMILAFPVALVSTMRMELRKKIIVIAVLSLGVFSVSDISLPYPPPPARPALLTSSR